MFYYIATIHSFNGIADHFLKDDGLCLQTWNTGITMSDYVIPTYIYQVWLKNWGRSSVIVVMWLQLSSDGEHCPPPFNSTITPSAPFQMQPPPQSACSDPSTPHSSNLAGLCLLNLSLSYLLTILRGPLKSPSISTCHPLPLLFDAELWEMIYMSMGLQTKAFSPRLA